MGKVISIGTFAGGSYGVAGNPSRVYEYFAVEGDTDAQGFPRFASPHREAVESYARGLEATATAPTGGRTPYLTQIVGGIGRAVVAAAGRVDRSEEQRLRRLAADLADWPAGKPLPQGAERYATV